MGKYSSRYKSIIALAYCHRYGWIGAMMLVMIIFPDAMFYTMSICMLAFAIWSLVGYHCKWRHIYCSYQNAYHKQMTPDSIRWHRIKKRDAYGVPIIFLVFGILTLCFAIFY